jgi:hypothetical protein
MRWLLLFTVWWLVVLSTLGGFHAGMPGGVVVLMALAEAAILVLAVLEYRSAVIVAPDGLTVRASFRTQRFGWDEVLAVDVGTQGIVAGPAASIRLRDGRRIGTPLWSGGLGAGNRSTERRIRSLRADVEAHRRTPMSTPPGDPPTSRASDRDVEQGVEDPDRGRPQDDDEQ